MIVDLILTGADITLPNTGGVAWTPVTQGDDSLVEIDIPARVGDRVECGYAGMRTGTDPVDIAVMVGDVQVMYMSTKSAVPAGDGDVAWYASGGGPFFPHGTDRCLTVTDDELDGAVVRFVLVSNGNGTSIVNADANNTFYLKAMNFGPAP